MTIVVRKIILHTKKNWQMKSCSLPASYFLWSAMK